MINDIFMTHISEAVTHPARSIGVDSAKYLFRSFTRTDYGAVLWELVKCLKNKSILNVNLFCKKGEKHNQVIWKPLVCSSEQDRLKSNNLLSFRSSGYLRKREICIFVDERVCSFQGTVTAKHYITVLEVSMDRGCIRTLLRAVTLALIYYFHFI